MGPNPYSRRRRGDDQNRSAWAIVYRLFRRLLQRGEFSRELLCSSASRGESSKPATIASTYSWIILASEQYGSEHALSLEHVVRLANAPLPHYRAARDFPTGVSKTGRGRARPVSVGRWGQAAAPHRPAPSAKKVMIHAIRDKQLRPILHCQWQGREADQRFCLWSVVLCVLRSVLLMFCMSGHQSDWKDGFRNADGAQGNCRLVLIVIARSGSGRRL